jgi:hypothetical protein
MYKRQPFQPVRRTGWKGCLVFVVGIIWGQTTEEVWIRLDKYLNDAYLAGPPKVRIIHGKGKGALRL